MKDRPSLIISFCWFATQKCAVCSFLVMLLCFFSLGFNAFGLDGGFNNNQGGNRLNKPLVQIVENNADVIVRQLDDEWLVYDDNIGTYVPYNLETHNYHRNASLWLNAESDKYFFSIVTKPGLCVYFNNKLFYTYQKVDTALIDLAKIYKQLPECNKDIKKVFLTVYHQSGNLPLENTYLINSPLKNLGVGKVSAIPGLLPKAKLPWSLPSGFTIYLLSLATCYAGLRNFAGKTFGGFFSFGKFFSDEIDVYGQADKKVWSSFTLFLMVINALSLSFIFYLTFETQIVNSVITRLFFLNYETLGVFVTLLNFVVIGLAFFGAKYLLIYVTGIVFSLEKISGPHYYEFLRISTILAVTLMVPTLACKVSHIISADTLIMCVRYMVISLSLLRVVKLAILLNKWRDVRNLYLFAYLCTTEVIPLVFIVKLIF